MNVGVPDGFMKVSTAAYFEYKLTTLPSSILLAPLRKFCMQFLFEISSILPLKSNLKRGVKSSPKMYFSVQLTSVLVEK
jgi:hypothetical protein